MESEELQSRLVIEKKNGQVEPFDQYKMVRSISRAGIPFQMAQQIGKSLVSNLSKMSDNTEETKKIRSVELKEMIIKELRDRNEQTIADSYSGYRKDNTELQSSKFDSKVRPSGITHEKKNVKDKDNVSGAGSKRGLS